MTDFNINYYSDEVKVSLDSHTRMHLAMLMAYYGEEDESAMLKRLIDERVKRLGKKLYMV